MFKHEKLSYGDYSLNTLILYKCIHNQIIFKVAREKLKLPIRNIKTARNLILALLN